MVGWSGRDGEVMRCCQEEGWDGMGKHGNFNTRFEGG